MEEKFSLVKEKASTLKANIEKLLSDFRAETGYTAMVSIETKIKKTNDRDIVMQNVSVTVTVQ